MKTLSSFLSLIPGSTITLVAASLLSGALPSAAAADALPVDDFSLADEQPSGMPRMIFTDAEAGGKSAATQSITDGVMSVTGTIAPGRGSPGFVSIPHILNADGSPRDLSDYEGVKIRVKVIKGSLMVQVASADITNFDYHTSAPITRDPAKYQEVEIPFANLNRVWSEKTPINVSLITSVNLVCAGMMPDAFAYEVDEIVFY